MDSAIGRTPQISVVVPNYNHARYLPQRLESILRQTYPYFELIVLDDASTDRSVEVLRPYATRGEIQLVANTQNSGSPFAQWARGANLARGELLWIAESDDFADPCLLEKLVAVFLDHPNVGLAYCQSWQVDSGGNVGGSCERWNHGLDPVRWTADYLNHGPHEVARYLCLQNTIPNASAVLLRTELLRRAVVGADAFRLSGDWRTWINVLMESDVGFVAEALNYFRIHDRSVRDTTRLSQNSAECLTVKAYACGRSRALAQVRARAFEEEFPRWVQCLNAEGLQARLPWVARTIRDGFGIWPAGGWRMLGSLVSTLLKRVFKRRLFTAPSTPR